MGFNTLLKDTTTEQIITDMRVGTRCPLVEGWSLHSLQHSASLNAIDRERFKKDFLVCVYVHACMWVSCACVQKFNCSNVLPSLIFFMCVPRVPATFLQIFIPGVKRSWSLSPVYSPVLSLSRLLYWPFFILTESDRREGTKSQGAEKEQVSVEWGQGKREGARRKPLVKRERHVVREKRVGGAVQCDGWLVIL